MNANYPAFADPAWYQQQAVAKQAAAQAAQDAAQNAAAAQFTPNFDLSKLHKLGIGPLPGLTLPPPSTWGTVPAPTGQAFGPITNLPAQTAPIAVDTLNPDRNASGGAATATGLTSIQTAIIVGVAGVSAYYLWQAWGRT